MPDIFTQLGQYCVIDTDTHDDEYLVCDFCNDGGILLRAYEDIIEVNKNQD